MKKLKKRNFFKKDVIFQYNKLSNGYDAQGYGSLSFFGAFLSINHCIFQYNENTEGSGIYLDASNTLPWMNITIVNSIFQSNIAASGAGLFFGANIWKITASFENLTCRNNSATGRNFAIFDKIFYFFFPQVGGCASINFNHKDSKFDIKNCLFSENSALLGGALYILHKAGILNLFSNKFIENSTPLNQYCGGGAITIIGLLTSFVVSRMNLYQYNAGFRGILIRKFRKK